MQDLFVLVMSNGKIGGTYLEIGASHPEYLSNTKTLEDAYGWKGVGVDIDPIAVKSHEERRGNPCVLADATTLDYRETLEAHGLPLYVDYLSVDCEPAANTLLALEKAIADGVRPGIITFEHEEYYEGTEVRDKSRELLKAHGYDLIASGVCVGPDLPFEDWWAHKDRYPAYLRAALWTKDSAKVMPGEVLFCA